MKLSFSLLVSLVVPCLGKCYYPNGTQAGDFPCDPNAETTVCCSDVNFDGYACLSNKLCQSPTGRIIRGTCTDPTWQSPDCPNYCLQWADGGRDMISCSNVTQKDTSYCCLGMEGCCNSGVGRFEVLPSKPYVWAQWNKEAGGYVVKTPLSAASSSSSSSASSTSLTASGTSTATSKASSAAGETSASNESKSSSDGTRVPTETGAPGQGGASQPSPATETGQPSGLSTAAQAGIGVGAAAGALLVAAVAYLWWKLRKVQQANQGLKTAQWQDPQDDAYPTQFLAPPYYPQNPQQKYELQATGEAHELQGHHYFVRGDASSAEMTTQHGYAPESPVTSFGHAR